MNEKAEMIFHSSFPIY